MHRFVYLKNVSTLKLDQTKCNSCGTCTKVCPHAVMRLANGTAEIVDRDACMECGACVRNCPRGAFSVEAGVGCAQALLRSSLSKNKEVCCA